MLMHDDFEAVKNPLSSVLDFPKHSNEILSILFNRDLSPVREVISRSNTRATGKWPSWKMGVVRYESENEKNAFKLLDASPEVIGYYPQPCIIKYKLDGEKHIHYPDILVKFHDRQEIWEVKTLEDSLTPEVHRRTTFMEYHLYRHGYQYRVAIAEELKLNPRLQNIETLIRLGRERVSFQERETIRQLFLKQAFITWGAFEASVLDTINKRQISRLILEGGLTCDLTKPITASTLVSAVKLTGGAS